MDIKRNIAVAAAALAGALGAGAPASAQELIYGSWPPAGEYLNRVALPKIFEGIAKETNGAVKWKLVPGGQLGDPKSTYQAVQDGLMSAGFAIATYVPSTVPAVNTVYSTIVFGDDNVATSGAALETVTLNCPACQAEVKKLNAVALAGWVAGPYYLACRTPVASLAELKGKRVRATGGSTELMTMLGAVPVSATLPEAVGLLQRGGLDCQFGTHGWLKVFGYADVVKAVTLQPLGMTGPAMGMLINRDVWSKFTPEQKKVHVKYASQLSAMLSIGQFIVEEELVLNEVVKTKGIALVKANPAGFDPIIAQYDAVQRRRNIENATKFGVQNPAGLIDAYAANRKKWQRLSKDIGRDIGKFAATIQREIYDKIDPNKL